MAEQILQYKLELVDEQTLLMPKDADILSADEQNGNICLWAVGDPEAEKERRVIEVFPTGYPIPEGLWGQRKFISTVQIRPSSQHEMRLVFHVFERFVIYTR